MGLQLLSQISFFVPDNLGILIFNCTWTYEGLFYNTTNRQVSTPIFAYFILLIIFIMCKPNLIVILPTPGAKRSQSLNNNIIFM